MHQVYNPAGTNTQSYQYLGNLYDPDSKLYDFHARAYDPSVGRFTSKDPISRLATMPQTLNPYVYGWNNPFFYPDPSGLFGFGYVGGADLEYGVDRQGVGGNASYSEGVFKDETTGFSGGDIFGKGGYQAGEDGTSAASYPRVANTTDYYVNGAYGSVA